ncbi:MAG: acyl-CoA dehydrogenase family protein [Alphaproteobacteria bacterium]|nr:acyl-CoA dehydrogenase family protein [Rhodobiaceae bacterium]PDH51001.1 MAG: acyl-CoA dehydrogenase [alpha proteobacterium MED-G09]|tara:strand:- start:527 stop:1666 length:1140 start_codon:yes stop_codon:yes gene_type:complete
MQLSEEQIAFYDMAKDFAIKKMAPNAEKWDEEKIFPVDTLRELAELGFGGIYVNPDLGGSGLSRLDSTLIFESLSHGCTSTAAFLSIHNMANWMIDSFGSNELKERIVPDLCTMKKIASYCLTEAGAGSDAGNLKTKAVKDGDHYIVNGTKSFISGGGYSDVYVTMVRTGDKSSAGISTLMIEKDSPGISFGAQEKKMGWNSQPTAQVIFEDCRVPVKNLLGNEGDGFKIAMKGLDGGRLNIAACSLGTAQSAFERAVEYVGDREQFGKKIQDFQSIQFKLADMATELEASRLMLRSAAAKVDENAPDKTKSAAMAKRFVTDLGFKIVNEALQIHGGYGYLKDYPLERNLRDVRVHQILEGTNEIMKVIISREILKENK